MALRVSETKAGRSISAYIVMRDNEHVATIRFHFGDSGVVRCDVWLGGGWANELYQGSAGGGGYDKQTAAISGVVIGGYKILNNGEEWERQLRDAGFIVIQAI